jgi:hypothetical protein
VPRVAGNFRTGWPKSWFALATVEECATIFGYSTGLQEAKIPRWVRSVTGYTGLMVSNLSTPNGPTTALFSVEISIC